jgi:hypothetical protein
MIGPKSESKNRSVVLPITAREVTTGL